MRSLTSGLIDLKFKNLLLPLLDHFFPSISWAWRLSLKFLKSLLSQTNLTDQELYVSNANVAYLIVLNTQNTTTSFKSFLPSIRKVCIELLAFVNFENVRF